MNLKLITVFSIILLHRSDGKPFLGLVSKLKNLSSNLGISANIGLSLDHKGGLLGDFSKNYGLHFGTGLKHDLSHETSGESNNEATITTSGGSKEESTGIDASAHGNINYGASGSLSVGQDNNISSNEETSASDETSGESGDPTVSGKTLILGHVLNHLPTIKRNVSFNLQHGGGQSNADSSQNSFGGGISGQFEISGNHQHGHLLGNLVNKVDNVRQDVKEHIKKVDNIRKDIKDHIHNVENTIWNGVSGHINNAISSNSQGGIGTFSNSNHNFGISANGQSSLSGQLPHGSGAEINKQFDLNIGHSNNGNLYPSQRPGPEFESSGQISGEASFGTQPAEINANGNHDFSSPGNTDISFGLNGGSANGQAEYSRPEHAGSAGGSEPYTILNENQNYPNIAQNNQMLETEISSPGNQGFEQNDQSSNDGEGEDNIQGKNSFKNGNVAEILELPARNQEFDETRGSINPGSHGSINGNVALEGSERIPSANEHSGSLNFEISGSHQFGGLLHNIKNKVESVGDKIKNDLSNTLHVDGSSGGTGSLGGSISFGGSLEGSYGKPLGGSANGGAASQNSLDLGNDGGFDGDLTINHESSALDEDIDALSKMLKPDGLSYSGRDSSGTDEDDEIYDDIAAYNNNRELFDTPEFGDDEEEGEDETILGGLNQNEAENPLNLEGEHHSEANSEQGSSVPSTNGEISGTGSGGNANWTIGFEGSSHHGTFWKGIYNAFQNLGHKLKEMFPSIKYSLFKKNSLSGGTDESRNEKLQNDANGGFKIGFHKTFNINAGGSENGGSDQSGNLQSRLILNNIHGHKIHGLWDTFKNAVSNTEDKIHNLASAISSDFTNKNFNINVGRIENGGTDQSGNLQSRFVLNNNYGEKIHGLWDTFKNVVSNTKDKVHHLASAISSDLANRNFSFPRASLKIEASGRIA